VPPRPPLRLAVLMLVLTFTAAACGSGSAASPADAPPERGVTTVDAKDLKFRPAAVQVAPGTEITWRFVDGSVPHNVKGVGFASKTQDKGTFSHRFEQPGEYRYTCTLHAGMDGRVVVAAG
jgi:plastocyanin